MFWISPEMIIRRQSDGDHYGDQRNDQMVRAQAEEGRAWFGHDDNPAILAVIEPIKSIERHRDRSRYHRVFQDQIIKPVPRERRLGPLHDALSSLATSGLIIVVLASHS